MARCQVRLGLVLVVGLGLLSSTALARRSGCRSVAARVAEIPSQLKHVGKQLARKMVIGALLVGLVAVPAGVKAEQRGYPIVPAATSEYSQNDGAIKLLRGIGGAHQACSPPAGLTAKEQKLWKEYQVSTELWAKAQITKSVRDSTGISPDKVPLALRAILGTRQPRGVAEVIDYELTEARGVQANLETPWVGNHFVSSVTKVVDKDCTVDQIVDWAY